MSLPYAAGPGSAPTPAVEVPAAVKVPVWAWALVLVALAVVYLLLQENGALLAGTAQVVHEFTHDGRHAFGVPCH